MDSVLVVFASSHPVDLDAIRTELSGYEIDALEIPAEHYREPAAEDAVVDALDDHVAILTRIIRVTRRAVEAAPNLAVVGTHSAGYDYLDLDALTEHGVVSVHNPDGPAPGVVEHTFAMAFTLLRDLPRRYDDMAEGDWFGAREAVPELGRKTVGVIGLGTIGYDVASQAAAGFGAETIAYDPYVTGEEESRIYPRVDRETVESSGIELVERAALFDRADVVCVHAPLTEATRHSIGKAEFDRLDGGWLVNVARGPIVREDALLAALEDGRVAGAGLDVFEEEPSENDALLAHPKVQATPHIAGFTDGFIERTGVLAAERIRTVLDGGRPKYVINPEIYD
jgi:D-3-phosphoglycerate dehydrogenase